MFVSHHQSVHLHTTGNHPSTHHPTDPVSKPESGSLVSKSLVAPRSVSSKLVPQTSIIRAGTGKHSHLTQQQHTTTTTATTFAPRPYSQVSGSAPTATAQARFGSHHPGLPVSLPVNRAPNANGNSSVIGAVSRNPPAVKFLFKKPQLPATISSSSALYHFNSQNSSTHTSTNSAGNSLSKFSIPKVSANGVSNGDLSSLSTTGKPIACASSLLDHSSSRVSYLSTDKHVNGGPIDPVTPYQPEQPHFQQFTFSKHQPLYGNQSKSKGATNSKSTCKSSVSGKESTLYGQHNDFKSASKASTSGANVANASSTSSVNSNSARSVSQQCQLSAKSEHSSKSSKVLSTSSSQHGNNRSSSGLSLGKESSKERHSTLHAKKENVSTKSSKSSSRTESNNKKSFQDKKSKLSKTLDPSDSSLDDSIKKSKSKKESRDRPTLKQGSSLKVKVEDEESLLNSKKQKLKLKDKEKSVKKDKKRKRDAISSHESEESEPSEDEGEQSKPKRRRHNSDSSSSSLAGAGNDSVKDSPDESPYLYHPQAAASLAKGSLVQDSGRMFASRETHPALLVAERTKQKLLADSVGGHFPALLHNSKLSQSPSNLFAGTSFSAPTSGHHSPNLASSPLSGSPSPSQKLISSKPLHLHEDSNGGSSGGGGVSKKERDTSSSSKKSSKVSRDMVNNKSATETERIQSAKIQYQDFAGITTIEFKQINKEKTWDSSNEVKKHKSSKESSKSSSSSSKLLTGSVNQGSNKINKSANYGEQANPIPGTCHENSNMQESSKLSASNSSLSSVSSSATKRSKKSTFTFSGSKKHSGVGDKEGGKKPSKKSKSEDASKKKKKRNHSPSPLIEGKMPPPVAYPSTHSKHLASLSNEHIFSDNSLVVAKGQLGSKLDHRHRSESPVLSASSSSSEVTFQPSSASKSSKKSKVTKEEMYQQGKVGHLKGQSYHHRKGKLDHESDCDNDDDDDDDKMSIASASSASSVSSHSSVSSSMSISSSASSLSASSASSEKNHSRLNKKTVSKEYSKNGHHHSKSSSKEHHSKSKVEIKEEPFEYGHKSYSKYGAEPATKPSKASKSKSSKPVRSPLSSEDEISGSDSESGSGNEHHSDLSEDERHRTKLPSNYAKSNMDHFSNSDSEDNDRRFVPIKNYKVPLLSTPSMAKSKKETILLKEESKRSSKGLPDESQPEEIKKVSKRNKVSSQAGQSLLAPIPESAKSMSPVWTKGKHTNKSNQTRKYSPLKRTSGYTGLSDSDSSMDEDDEHVDMQMEPHLSPMIEQTSNKNRKSKGHKGKKTHESNNLSSDSSSESSQSSEASSSESGDEDEEHGGNSLRPGTTSHSVSPQTTPNSRLPPSNIYSKANHHPPGHQSSPYQSIGYQSNERHSSLSPSMECSTLLIHSSGFTFVELRDIQLKIAHLADRELLQQVVDLIEERNNRCFNIVNNCLQFDLLKLDQSTLVEIKRLIS